MIQGVANKEYIINNKGWKLIMKVNKKSIAYLDATPIALFNFTDTSIEHEEKNYINNLEYNNKVEAL